MAQKPGASTPDYLYVCFDVDPTGRRFIDEICQFAAYCPTSNFKQYVMPYNDIDVNSRKKHLIRTTTVGRYRILKSMVSGKVFEQILLNYGDINFL
jgi:maternal-effect protein exuperantia